MPVVNMQFPPSISVANLNGINGFVISVFPASSQGGTSVSGAGDVNGDGIADLVVGAPHVSPCSTYLCTGASYVIFGQAGIGGASIPSLTGSNGFVITGFFAESEGGLSVSGAGDVNGDGIADLIIGAPYYYTNSYDGSTYSYVGASYVLFGKSGLGSSGSVDVSGLTNGFVITGFPANSYSGLSVSGAGDVNGDGIADLIIGAPYTYNDAGASYVLFGKSGLGNSGSVDVSGLTGSNGFEITGFSTPSWGGYSVRGVGDVNDDGIADLIIGAPYLNNYAGAGAGYVLFGKSGLGSSGSVSVSSLTGSNGFVITGFAAGSISVSGAGDVNEDGIADLIIGVSGASSSAGASYVLFGKSGLGSSGSVSISSITGSNGFVITGFPANSGGGVSVSGAGDVNGDGVADLIIGANGASSSAGASYVVFGKSGLGISGSMNVSSLAASNGFAITGFPAGSNAGVSVSGAGDVNHDGIADLIIGAPYNYGSSYSGASYVIFGESTSPVLLSINQLFIKEGQTLPLSSQYLNATIPKSPSKDSTLQFIISGIQHGRFYSSTNPSLSLTSFTQQQVQSGQIYFAQDGSGWAPSYNVNVGYPGLFAVPITPPQPALITFQQSFVLANNNLTINQGQTLILTSSFLSANDLYNSPNNPNLVFSISAVQHGYFALISAPSAPITTFTQAQIQSGEVQFVQDGSTNPPSYNVVVIDGAASTSAQPAAISFDAIPIINTNNISINQGQTIILNSSNLSATNPYNSGALLTFTVSNIQHGYFALISAPSTPITSFTQAQIQSGSVQFVQDDSVNPPSYDVTVSDGRIASSLQSVTVSFDAIPLLTTNAIVINQGQTIILSASNLNATNPYNRGVALTFTVSNVQHGYFALISAPTTVITSFSQTQIQSNVVQFKQDGTIRAPNYNVTVSDGRMFSSSQAATISFDCIVIDTNSITINQGQTVGLSPSNLSATNPYNSGAILTFIVSNAQHGYFALKSVPTTPIASFTLTQIQSGDVQFVHDGTSNPPSYTVSVSDGRMTTPTQAGTISFDVPPTLVANTLTINQGQTVVLSSSNLNATDPYTSSFTFIISNIQHGYFSLVSSPSIPITDFSQTQIDDDDIQFTHDGSRYSPNFNVAVSDGRMSSTPQACIVSFDAIIFVKNNLIINQGQTLILSPTYLSVVDPYNNGTTLTFTISNVLHGYFAFTSVPATPITSFTQTQIQNGIVQFVPDGTVNPPSFNMIVSDSRMTSSLQVGGISFDVPPKIVTNSLTVNQGQAAVLALSDLSASDPYTSSFTFTASTIHGYFALVSAPTSPIIRFTQAQIQSGNVQFVPDGTTIPPSYNVTVSDGRMSSGFQAGEITFYLAPILTSNQLTINQGQSIILNVINLSATNPYGNSPGLTFVISNIQHGYFALTVAPTTPVTSFTLGDIQRNNVQFVTDGSIYPPNYGVGVKNAYMTTFPQSPSISFDAMPVITANALTINQGQAIVLTTSDLDAINPYNSAASLTFTVTNVQHGNFFVVGNPTVPTNTFSLSQIQAQAIQFATDGGIYSPVYDVTVTDGRMTSAAQACTVSFDAMPLFTRNAITVNQGQTIILAPNYLNATNPYNPAAILTFMISDVQHGIFALITNPNQAVFSFTQQQVQNGGIMFGTDDSAIAPRYNISVTDGRLTTASLAGTIVFNSAPMLMTNVLFLYQGQTQVLTSSQLSAVDPDDAASSLTFLMSDVQAGQFEKISNPKQPISSFTQAEVQGASILFVADGSFNSPSYYVAVSDGKVTTGAQSASVFFSAPTLIKNQIDIIQGQTIILSAKDLSAIDKGTNPSMSNLNFISSRVKQGYFAYVESPTYPITQFTQDQLRHGEIQFTHDGSSNPPSYWMAVSDGTFVATPRAGNVTFHPTPVITANRLSILEGATSILSTSDLSVSDPNSASLVFSVSQIAHGYFARVNDPAHSITNFTHAQLQAQEIAFIPDETGLAPAYQVSVSDGYSRSLPLPALITFSTPAPIVTSNTIRNSIIGSAVSGTAGLLFLGFQLYLQNKTNRDLRRAIEKSDVDMIQPVAKKVFERINTLNILGYRSRKNADAYIYSIGQMIKRVEELNGRSLKEMDIHQRSWFVNEMAKQIKKKVGKDPSCCSCAYLASFFKAEATPQEFQAKIEEVSLAVHSAFPTTDSDKKIELRTT